MNRFRCEVISFPSPWEGLGEGLSGVVVLFLKEASTFAARA